MVEWREVAVLMKYFQAEKEKSRIDYFVDGITILDAFDIRGCKIWVSYKSIYNKNIEKCIEGIWDHTFVSSLFANPEFQKENAYYEKNEKSCAKL